MKTDRLNAGFCATPMALAMIVASAYANAEDLSEAQQLSTPESSFSVGLGAINNAKDAKRFRQYTGFGESGTYGLVDFDWVKRDDALGQWTVVKGRNLGLENREFGVSQQRQGNWKYAVDYNEIVRYDPYTVHTGTSGIGSASPGVTLIANPLPDIAGTWGATGAGSANEFAVSNGVPGTDVDLKIKRRALGLSAEKRLSPALSFEATFRQEEKKGARLFGRAGLASDAMAIGIPVLPLATGNWAVLLTPEPINSSIRQIELAANYGLDRFAISGGYYATFYVNHFGSLAPSVPATLNRGALTAGGTPAGALSIQQLASSPIALPPDNQSQQLFATGRWTFSNATNANFRLAYTRAEQSESFASQGLTPTAPGAPSNLGGVVNTTLAQVTVNSRATDKLSANASARYERRDDGTPVRVYNIGAGGGGLDNTTNWPSSSQVRTSAQATGIYRLDGGYTAMFGVDWENKNSPLPPTNTAIVSNQVFVRQRLGEYGLHAELRSSLAESLSGAVGAEWKRRRGTGDWVTSSAQAGLPTNLTVPGSINRVLPDMYMDRDRSKLKASFDWTPTKRWSVQAILEHAKDEYKRDYPLPIAANVQAGILASPTLPGAPIPGARNIDVDSLSLDATYTVTGKWQLSSYWTHMENRWNVNKVNVTDDTRNRSDTFGLKLKGKLTDVLEAGLDLTSNMDVTTFQNMLTTAAGTVNIVGFNGTTIPGGNYLPKITVSSTRLNLFGDYALAKSKNIVANLGYQRFKTNDWQWGYKGVPFIYSDNTTVSQPMTQNVWFVGASYVLRMQ